MPDVENRLSAFPDGHGMSSDSPNLNDSQTVQEGNSTFTPNGVSMQLVPSDLGSSEKDYQRGVMGGGAATPTDNGMSQSTYEAKRPLMNTSMGV